MLSWAVWVYLVGVVLFTVVWRRELGEPPKPVRGVQGDALAVGLALVWPLVIVIDRAMRLARWARPKADSDG